MNYLEYLPIFVFVIIAIGLSMGFAVLSGFVGPNNPDKEKLSAYECGFPPFDDARGRFDVRFYLVAILFIIFDLEVAFLFPWAISFICNRSSRLHFYDDFSIYFNCWFYI